MTDWMVVRGAVRDSAPPCPGGEEGVEMAEETWFLGASVAAGEVQVERTLYHRVSGAAVARGPERRNAVGDEVTQGKGPRRLEAAGLKRDGLVAEGTQVDYSLEKAATEAGEKLLPGCPTSLPSVCTCNTKNGVISDRWR